MSSSSRAEIVINQTVGRRAATQSDDLHNNGTEVGCRGLKTKLVGIKKGLYPEDKQVDNATEIVL